MIARPSNSGRQRGRPPQRTMLPSALFLVAASAYVPHGVLHAPATKASKAAASASPLPHIAMLAESDQVQWCADVESADKLTVVFFYAPWCRCVRIEGNVLQRLC